MLQVQWSVESELIGGGPAASGFATSIGHNPSPVSEELIWCKLHIFDDKTVKITKEYALLKVGKKFPKFIQILDIKHARINTQ